MTNTFTENQEKILARLREQGLSEQKIQEVKDGWIQDQKREVLFNEKWTSCPELEEYTSNRSISLFKHILCGDPMSSKTLAKMINADYERHLEKCKQCYELQHERINCDDKE